MSDHIPLKKKRSTYLLDRQWQLSVFRNMAGVALVAGVAQMGVTQFISSQDPLERWSGQQIGLLALGANVFFLGVVFLAFWVVAVRVTHAVVGPALVIQRAVDGLVHGEYGSRLKLRDRDYLKDVAASVEVLTRHLEQQDANTHKLSNQLESALANGDISGARELVQQLRGSQEHGQKEDLRCAA